MTSMGALLSRLVLPPSSRFDGKVPEVLGALEMEKGSWSLPRGVRNVFTLVL